MINKILDICKAQIKVIWNVKNKTYIKNSTYKLMSLNE
jgi:hypothetical protein